MNMIDERNEQNSMQSPQKAYITQYDSQGLPEGDENALLQQSNSIPTHVTIQIEQRKFHLSLENLDIMCRQKIIAMFAQKHYSLEELLTLFVTMLRDQSFAEQELLALVKQLQS